MVDTNIQDSQPSADTGHPTTWSVGPVASHPYAWPYDGSVDTRHLAVVCIDWQTDFCGPAAMSTPMGYDIGLTRAGLPATAHAAGARPRLRA